MRFRPAYALGPAVLLALTLRAETVSAQLAHPTGVRPLTPPPAPAPLALDAYREATGSIPATRFTLVAPALTATGGPVGNYDSFVQEREGPSLWKHLVVGTVAGTTVGFAVSYVGYVLLCNCDWAGLGVMISTSLGAGAGLLAGGAVYAVKRTQR